MSALEYLMTFGSFMNEIDHCSSCEHRDTCDIADQTNFCKDCKYFNDCDILETCEKGEYVECNNGFEPKYDDEYNEEEDEE